MEVESKLACHDDAFRWSEARRLAGGSDYEPRREWEIEEEDDDNFKLELNDFEEYQQTFKLHHDLRDVMLFEATISGRLQEGKIRFASRANLVGVEVDAWLYEEPFVSKLRKMRISLPSSVHLTINCMERYLRQGKVAILNKNVLMVQSHDQVAHKVESAKAAITTTLDQLAVPQVVGCSENASKELHMEQSRYCENCNIHGHLTMYCKILYPDEEDMESVCGNCQKYGHHKNECWELRPDLKAEYNKKLSRKKANAACEECGATGKARSYYWMLHSRAQIPETEELSRIPDLTHSAGTVSNLTSNLRSRPAPYNYYASQESIQLTKDELKTSQILIQEKPSFDDYYQKFCGSCNVYGQHRDADCPVPDKPMTMTVFPQQSLAPRRNSRFPKPAK